MRHLWRVALAASVLLCAAVIAEDAECEEPQQLAVHPAVQQLAHSLAHAIERSRDTVLRAPDFTTFLEQDLHYHLRLRLWIQANVTSLCKPAGECGGFHAEGLARMLTFPRDSIPKYETLYNVTQSPDTDPTINDLDAFYREHTSCRALVSALMFRVCAYPRVAKQLEALDDAGAFATWTHAERERVLSFVAYNTQRDGAQETEACAFARAVLDEMNTAPDASVLRRAAELEAALWGVELPRAVDNTRAIDDSGEL